jgi:hypothetical protein
MNAPPDDKVQTVVARRGTGAICPIVANANQPISCQRSAGPKPAMGDRLRVTRQFLPESMRNFRVIEDL